MPPTAVALKSGAESPTLSSVVMIVLDESVTSNQPLQYTLIAKSDPSGSERQMRTDGKTEQQSPSLLLRENRGPVSILTLNRPEKLNALSNELISAIMNALDDIELDRSIRVIVITGAGRAFSSGADIAAFQRHM